MSVDPRMQAAADEIKEGMKVIVELTTLKFGGSADSHDIVDSITSDLYDDTLAYAGSLLLWQAFGYMGCPWAFEDFATALAEMDYMRLEP